MEYITKPQDENSSNASKIEKKTIAMEGTMAGNGRGAD
jgi:hypothetical protein